MSRLCWKQWCCRFVFLLENKLSSVPPRASSIARCRNVLTGCRLSSLRAPHLGRELVCKESKKNFKATIAMSQDFPLGIESWVFCFSLAVGCSETAAKTLVSFRLLHFCFWNVSLLLSESEQTSFICLELLPSVTICWFCSPSGCWMFWRWSHPSSTLINSGSLFRWSSPPAFLSNSVSKPDHFVFSLRRSFIWNMQRNVEIYQTCERLWISKNPFEWII